MNLKAILRSPAFWGIAVVLLLALPGVPSYDFQATDNLHLGVVSGALNHPQLTPLNLYRFSDGTPGINAQLISENYIPWFASLRWKFSFCRVLPSLLIAAHYRVFGANTASYPLHGLLWLVVLIALLAKLVDALFPASHRALPFVAILMYSVSTAHASLLFYSAARYMLIIAVWTVAALLAHIKYREQGWNPGRWIALLAIALSLFTGEAALSGIVFLVCYELFCSDPLYRRLKELAPMAAIVGIYLVLYRAGGYGTAGQDAYVNPFGEPFRFLQLLPGRMAALAGETFCHVSLMPYVFRKHEIASSVAGIAVVAAVSWPAWRAASRAEKRRLNWLAASTLLSLVPMCSGIVSPRMTVLASIGGSMILAFAMSYWWQRMSDPMGNPAGLAGLLVLLLAWLQFVSPPLRWMRMNQETKEYAPFIVKFHDQEAFRSITPSQKWFFLNYSDWSDPMDEYDYRKIREMPVPAAWRQLAFTSLPLTIHRVSENTLELTSTKQSLIDYAGMLHVYRGSDEPFHAGDVIRLPEVQIRILQTDGYAPTRAEFTFPGSLDSPEYRFFKFADGMLVPVKLPPAGASASI